MNTFSTFDDLPDITGKTVVLRADLNVPFKDGKVTDDSRLTALLPSLRELSAKGCKTVIISHFGRPEGRRNPAYSLAPVATRLNALFDFGEISFVNDCIGDPVKARIHAMKNGDILICENLRFYNGETENAPAFAQQLAALGDLYVNDAFSAAHRAHASTVGIACLLPAYAGRLMEAELNALSAALESPKRPIAAIVGGAKISTKLSVLHNLVKKTDHLILGGGMANTFLFAQGAHVGKSLHEPDMKAETLQIMQTAEAHGCTLHLPSDVVIAEAFAAHAPHQTVPVDNIPENAMALDLGQNSIRSINAVIAASKTLLWNGPLGAFETPPFDKATCEVARFAADCVDKGQLYAIGGGGDTVAALELAGVKERFSYISTAGGAFLEYIEGKPLPGIAALINC